MLWILIKLRSMQLQHRKPTNAIIAELQVIGPKIAKRSNTLKDRVRDPVQMEFHSHKETILGEEEEEEAKHEDKAEEQAEDEDLSVETGEVETFELSLTKKIKKRISMRNNTTSH